MFDRPQRGERALLLFAGLGQAVSQEEQQEFEALAISAGAEIVGKLVSGRKEASPKYLIGEGKLESLAEQVDATCAELVLVDHHLSPRQQKNLEDFKFVNLNIIYGQDII